MKETLALGLFASATLLLAPIAHARPNAPAGAPPPPAAAPSAPPPSAPAQEIRAHAKKSFWLAVDPHVPLAMVEGHRIHSIGKRGKDCGAEARWAKPKTTWKAVDAWGQLTGAYEIQGSELWDVTSCHEVKMAPRSGKPGVGLFVSEDSSYKPGDSVRYSPSVLERKRFDRFMGTMESSFLDYRPEGKLAPLAKRSMFFEFAPPKDPNFVQRLDGAGKLIQRPKRWAVSGGPLLVVSYLGGNGHWKVATVKPPLGLSDSYKPVAVFDLNGDGIPEIVYQASDGPSYADHVLSLNRESLTWEDAAESRGGATM